MFGVEADRFDHEVEFVGAVDFARYAVGHIGPDEQGFGEVMAGKRVACRGPATETPRTTGTPSARAGAGDWR